MFFIQATLRGKSRNLRPDEHLGLSFDNRHLEVYRNYRITSCASQSSVDEPSLVISTEHCVLIEKMIFISKSSHLLIDPE